MSFVHSEQLFAVIDTLAKIVSEQVHVAQVLVRVLDKVCMLLFNL